MSGASNWGPLFVSFGGLALVIIGAKQPLRIPAILLGIFVCGLACGLALAGVI